MVKADDNSVKYAKQHGLSFVISTKIISCGWAGYETRLSVRPVKNFDDNDKYETYQQDGVNIYVPKALSSKSIQIYQRYKLPLLGPVFYVK